MFHDFCLCDHHPIHGIFSCRHVVLRVTSFESATCRTCTILPEPDSRICPYAIRSIHHAFLTGLRFESQWETHVERDELAGVSRNSLDGSATLGTVSPHQVLLLVRISRRNPICLTCEPASPGIAPMLFSRNGCAISLIQDSSFDSCERASSSKGNNQS